MSIRVEHLQKSFGTFRALKETIAGLSTGGWLPWGRPAAAKTPCCRIIAGAGDGGQQSCVALDGGCFRHHVRERQVGFVFQHYPRCSGT